MKLFLLVLTLAVALLERALTWYLTLLKVESREGCLISQSCGPETLALQRVVAIELQHCP